MYYFILQKYPAFGPTCIMWAYKQRQSLHNLFDSSNSSCRSTFTQLFCFPVILYHLIAFDCFNNWWLHFNKFVICLHMLCIANAFDTQRNYAHFNVLNVTVYFIFSLLFICQWSPMLTGQTSLFAARCSLYKAQ